MNGPRGDEAAATTPLAFEQIYGAQWDEIEQMLARINGATGKRKPADPTAATGPSGRTAAPDPARLAELYRRSCEHLALARARDYPQYLIDRLDRLTHEAHQVIYRRRDWGLRQLADLALVGFPSQVRALRRYVLVAALVFALPLVALGWRIYQQPSLILSIVDASQAQQFDEMYSEGAESIGRRRDADTDWIMFGFYVRNNISVAFQCFASGLVLGVGSLFYLGFNGVLIGAVAGYLTARGMAPTFYSFVATHAAFELTAIVLSGAAGLRIGHALLAPGRQRRVDALRAAAREAITVMYGVIAFLLIAAVLEAFWSSSRWIAPAIKYSVAALFWALVIAYLGWQGRPRREPRPVPGTRTGAVGGDAHANAHAGAHANERTNEAAHAR